ncbi:NADH:riboflavin 5'-phosphate oxidoreductase [Thalassocella blandensis]|nr:NADH:riboflavin 5'-phosphate oxidoreductase [Thalassocella blandensis]
MSQIEEDLAQALRQGMRNLASGVCVITAMTETGERVAMTASSVTSVSDNPPSLLVCINRLARMDGALAKTTGFTVNVLSRDHEDVSNLCAAPAEGDSRFQSGDWLLDEASGLFYLNDALSVFFCQKTQTVPYGTHNIYIGNIEKVKLGDPSAELLVYANGSYHYL